MVTHEIVGDDMQAVILSLGSGDEVRAEAGGMTFMTEGGGELRVDTGCLVAFDPSVQYDIQFVGGVKTAIFGGEGLFFAALTGPGRVWIQTLAFSRLADRILAARRGDREEVKRDFGGTLGKIGDLIGGDR